MKMDRYFKCTEISEEEYTSATKIVFDQCVALFDVSRVDDQIYIAVDDEISEFTDILGA
jgi:hypothetical protein